MAACGSQYVEVEQVVVVAYCSIEGDGQGVVDIGCRCSRSQGEVVLDPRCNLLGSLVQQA